MKHVADNIDGLEIFVNELGRFVQRSVLQCEDI